MSLSLSLSLLQRQRFYRFSSFFILFSPLLFISIISAIVHCLFLLYCYCILLFDILQYVFKLFFKQLQGRSNIYFKYSINYKCSLLSNSATKLLPYNKSESKNAIIAIALAINVKIGLTIISPLDTYITKGIRLSIKMII